MDMDKTTEWKVVTLANGRRFTTTEADTFVFAEDGETITEDEWQEYCAIRAQQETPDE